MLCIRAVMGRMLGVRAVIGCMTSSQPKQYMMSVFCDISRAFDVIDHKNNVSKIGILWI